MAGPWFDPTVRRAGPWELSSQALHFLGEDPGYRETGDWSHHKLVVSWNQARPQGPLAQSWPSLPRVA